MAERVIRLMSPEAIRLSGPYRYVRDLPKLTAANCFCGPDEYADNLRALVRAGINHKNSSNIAHVWRERADHPEPPSPFITKPSWWQRIRGTR